MLLVVSVATLCLVLVPYRSHTLAYISQNGAVNLYMFLVSYLFESDVESDYSYEEEDGLEKHIEM